MEYRRHKRDETNRQKDSLKEGKGITQKGSTYFISELIKYLAQRKSKQNGQQAGKKSNFAYLN